MKLWFIGPDIWQYSSQMIPAKKETNFGVFFPNDYCKKEHNKKKYFCHMYFRSF
jgi:hypothetical protein